MMLPGHSLVQLWKPTGRVGFHSAVTLIVLLLGGGVCVAARTTSASKPNIIVILADDLGYGDLSCYGASKIHTANANVVASGMGSGANPNDERFAPR